ncbi:DUF2848 family protein [Rhodococcus sp. MSC1_016]|jgi:hypothetical protein|uniref:DUF2848 family protein n=1 Tax=Rhodococcus sp. MSC1_016 TaxID=2909266 RepID=UPI00202FC10F|nr:DUF2848 family protein [Rhodococcus sp. MSC1_016]
MTRTTTEPLVLHPVGSSDQLDMTGFRSIVAGYTGRDEAQVRHHIDELAAIGVAPPPQVPMFYPMPEAAVTTAATAPVGGDNTSGEIEPVLIRHRGKNYLGVGSDHTDRTLETVDIGESKQACPKPMGSDVIEIGDWSTFDWDKCYARSWVDGVLYQSGGLVGLRRPEDLLKILADRLDNFDDSSDFVCFAGTLPLLDGTFVPGTQWELELTLPDGQSLRHTYTTTKEL